MPRPKMFDPDEALDRAMKLFWERGYEATSIQDLVERMGINRFSLYDTFGSKRDLFLSALDRYRDEVVRDGVSMLEGPELGVPAVRSYFESALRSTTRAHDVLGCLMTNSAVEVAPRDAKAARKVRAHLERMESAFYRQLVYAKRQGQLPDACNVRELVRFLTGAAQGLGVMIRAGAEPRNLRSYIDVVLAVPERS